MTSRRWRVYHVHQRLSYAKASDVSHRGYAAGHGAHHAVQLALDELPAAAPAIAAAKDEQGAPAAAGLHREWKWRGLLRT